MRDVLRGVGWVALILVGPLAACAGGGYTVAAMVREGAPTWAWVAVLLGCLLAGGAWLVGSIVLATRD